MKFLIFLLLLTDLGGRRVKAQSNSTICFLAKGSHNKSDLCGEHSSDLTCEDGMVIMIKKVTYQKKEGHNNNNCGDCRTDGNWQDWDIHPALFQHILHGTCSKKHQCSFDEAVEAPSNNGSYVWYARVMYECVQEEFIRNVCSHWETILGDEPLHMALYQNITLPRTCSCMIEATYINIFVVEYKPYINDFHCSDSSVFVDGRLFFQCDSETTGIDASVYNYALNVTNNSTNITISIQTMPLMFWIYIEGTETVTVSCDTSMPLQSTTTSVISTASAMPTTSKATTQKPTDRGESETAGISISAIVGGVFGSVLFVAVFVTTAYFIYKRRLGKISKTKYNEHTYENTELKKSKHVDGMDNNFHPVPTDGMDNKSHPVQTDGMDNKSHPVPTDGMDNKSHPVPTDGIINTIYVANEDRAESESGSLKNVNVEVDGAYTELQYTVNYQENKTSDYEELFETTSAQREV